jgi:hypothetical protein
MVIGEAGESAGSSSGDSSSGGSGRSSDAAVPVPPGPGVGCRGAQQQTPQPTPQQHPQQPRQPQQQQLPRRHFKSFSVDLSLAGAPLLEGVAEVAEVRAGARCMCAPRCVCLRARLCQHRRVRLLAAHTVPWCSTLHATVTACLLRVPPHVERSSLAQRPLQC